RGGDVTGGRRVRSGGGVTGGGCVGHLTGRARAVGRDGLPVGVEEAEFGLLGEDAVEGAVDEGFADGAGLDRFDEGFGEGVDGGEFDVDAGAEGEDRRLGAVRGDAVQGLQEADGEVVGDDRAGEAPFVAQQPGEQVLVGGHRDAVDLRVRVHHGPGAAEAERHLEGRQDDVGQFAGAHVGGGEVAAAAGGGVSGEVLEGGDDAGVLQASHVRGGDGADQVRVLADGL